MAFDFIIRTKEDLIKAVQTYGFLPLFAGSVPGFSVEEHAVPEVWYSPGSDDWPVWEWKGPVIRESGCAYGKFFEKKAAYVSSDWFLDLANYRRDGYDFDARYDDGLARFSDKELFEMIDRKAPVLSKELRTDGGYAYSGRWQKVEGKKGFDTSLARLQELCYVTTTDFVYATDRKGRKRGWGVAQYSTPEKWFGAPFTEKVYQRSPAESHDRLLEHLISLFPSVPEKKLSKFLK